GLPVDDHPGVLIAVDRAQRTLQIRRDTALPIAGEKLVELHAQRLVGPCRECQRTAECGSLLPLWSAQACLRFGVGGAARSEPPRRAHPKAGASSRTPKPAPALRRSSADPQQFLTLLLAHNLSHCK